MFVLLGLSLWSPLITLRCVSEQHINVTSGCHTLARSGSLRNAIKTNSYFYFPQANKKKNPYVYLFFNVLKQYIK